MVRRWLDRAERALASAALLIEAGDPDRACSSAYYAMFYAARAALFEVGQPERALGKTHAGILSAFNQYLIRPKLIEVEHGRALSTELNRRLIADYEADGVGEEGAEAALDHAQRFVSAVAQLISG